MQKIRRQQNCGGWLPAEAGDKETELNMAGQGEDSNENKAGSGALTGQIESGRSAQGGFFRKIEGLSLPEKETALWEALEKLQGYPFSTAKGLEFTYAIRGGEMFVDRKEKSITQATVFMAFEKALELGDRATGPKKLGTFGASYLYPVFVNLGIIGGK